MNVGIVTYYTQNPWDSLDHVLRSTAAALAEGHHIEPYPSEYPLASAARQRELLASWLGRCDVAVGPVDDRVLQAREPLDRRVPYVCFLMGSLSRGAVKIGGTYGRLRTSDILVGNCTADAVLCAKLFPNATARVVPFGVDTTLFQPADEATRQEARRRLGIGPREKVLLYAGRLSLEKNLHTLLQVFSVVRAAVPDVRLVIAGPERNVPFVEFGVFTLSIKPSLQRLAAQLGLDARSVLFVGQRTPEEMRALYSLADVAVNLTLHHDENFGFAQIEAMACGTPVVGTTWGGLKDTVIDGVTGRQVPAVVTPAGVKVDWWRAANAIVDLLAGDASLHDMRRRCRDVAVDGYSLARYRERLDAVVQEAVAGADRPATPLEPSAFARRLWAACARESDGPPPYRRGEESLQAYRELITPFAAESNGNGTSGDGHGDGIRVWCLPAPLVLQDDGELLVHDPIFPIALRVPAHLVDGVRDWLARFADTPVLPAAPIAANVAGDVDGARRADALAWMSESGLVLASERGTIDPACVPAHLGQPHVVMRRLDYRTDVVWVA